MILIKWLVIMICHEKAAAYGLRGEVADTVSGALARAREMASEEDMIFIGGSNFVVAEVLE